MELLTRNNFEGWMQKLMERLDRQDELLLAMKAEGKQPTITESIRLFDNQDLCMLLQISKRTLQRMRSEQRIVYVVLRGKCRYRQSEIDRLLDECTVNEDAATPQELKRNHTLRTGGTPKGRRT